MRGWSSPDKRLGRADDSYCASVVTVKLMLSVRVVAEEVSVSWLSRAFFLKKLTTA
jgi:hypothetical protein